MKEAKQCIPITQPSTWFAALIKVGEAPAYPKAGLGRWHRRPPSDAQWTPPPDLRGARRGTAPAPVKPVDADTPVAPAVRPGHRCSCPRSGQRWPLQQPLSCCVSAALYGPPPTWTVSLPGAQAPTGEGTSAQSTWWPPRGTGHRGGLEAKNPASPPREGPAERPHPPPLWASHWTASPPQRHSCRCVHS